MVYQLQINIAKTVEYDQSFPESKYTEAEAETLSRSSTARTLKVCTLYQCPPAKF
jgi:hypothetical protein